MPSKGGGNTRSRSTPEILSTPRGALEAVASSAPRGMPSKGGGNIRGVPPCAALDMDVVVLLCVVLLVSVVLLIVELSTVVVELSSGSLEEPACPLASAFLDVAVVLLCDVARLGALGAPFTAG